MTLLALDFLYMPSEDPAAELEWFGSLPGADVVFAIEAYGTRVAMVRLTPEPPALLLAGHLEGERPVLVYRVESLDEAARAMEESGKDVGPEFGIPHGPVREVHGPGGHRLAMYELTRPEAAERLAGRRDF